MRGCPWPAASGHTNQLELDLQSVAQRSVETERQLSMDEAQIGELQTRLRAEDQCMVQVAGNFHCLNAAHRSQRPDSGNQVELAFQKKTQ